MLLLLTARFVDEKPSVDGYEWDSLAQLRIDALLPQ